MSDWLKLITDWFVELIKSIFGLAADVCYDLVVLIFDMIFNVIGNLLVVIPAPSFMENGNNFYELLSGLPPFALFVVSKCHLPEAMAIVGAGVAFNLLRKLFTLGQW